MRVIAGKYKGRTLVSPKCDARPTLDRMKETLFNILNFDICGAVVLDLFAGSGQLSIECLSRGAVRAVLCDNSRESVAAIKANFFKIGVEPEIFNCDYSQCLKCLNNQFDIVFVDPPYHSGLYIDVLKKISQCNLLSDKGVIVCEHLADMDLPSNVAVFRKYDSRKIGTVMFDFYRRELCE